LIKDGLGFQKGAKDKSKKSHEVPKFIEKKREGTYGVIPQIMDNKSEGIKLYI
jgi:hypothetical protein